MVYASLDLETKLWSKGYRLVCGVDEVGRGCFAGPVVVGAVIFSPDSFIPDGLADSKLLTARERQLLDAQIRKQAVTFAIGEVGVPIINKVGIGQATQMAFRQAIKHLLKSPDFILIDAFYISHLNRKRQQAVKNGDKICSSIAAASIVAKVYRDQLMRKLHTKYPQYHFDQHKGYGTKLHQSAIKQYGLSKEHRMSFNLSKFL